MSPLVAAADHLAAASLELSCARLGLPYPRTPQGVLWLTDSDEPCLVRLLDGSVRLYISVEHAFAWESDAMFERWLENVTRQSVNP